MCFHLLQSLTHQDCSRPPRKPPELWDSHPCSRVMSDSLTPAAAVRFSPLQWLSVTASQHKILPKSTCHVARLCSSAGCQPWSHSGHSKVADSKRQKREQGVDGPLAFLKWMGKQILKFTFEKMNSRILQSNQFCHKLLFTASWRLFSCDQT